MNGALRILGNVVDGDVFFDAGLTVQGRVKSYAIEANTATIDSALSATSLSAASLTVGNIAAQSGAVHIHGSLAVANIITKNDSGPSIVFQEWDAETGLHIIPLSAVFRGKARASGTLTIHCKTANALGIATCSILADSTVSLFVTSTHSQGTLDDFRVTLGYSNDFNVGLGEEDRVDAVRVYTSPNASISWTCSFA
jgi:hypothetical protein